MNTLPREAIQTVRQWYAQHQLALLLPPFRTGQLRASLNPLAACGFSTAWPGAPLARVVSEVVRGRGRLSGLLAPPTDQLPDGQVMSFVVSRTLSDGMAHDATEGYFTEENCPPEDSWMAVAMERHPLGDELHLLFWVPTKLVPNLVPVFQDQFEECLLASPPFERLVLI